MKAGKQTRIPGEAADAPRETLAVAEETDGAPEQTKKGTTELNNIAGKTANDVGVERENIVRAMAVADAAKRGEAPDLAPAADIGKPAAPASIKREAMIGGVKVMVDVPVIRKNDAVEKFGKESKLPPGTLVNEDGTEFTGAGDAYGVIGHIDTPQGKLVNRIIAFDAMKSAA